MSRVSNAIRRLCLLHGLPIFYFSVTSTSGADAVTRLKNLTYSIHSITKAIIQGGRDYRAFVYDLAFISANKDFTTGGFFDANDRTVIFDTKTLPHLPRVDDYLYFKGETYVITEVNHLEETYYRLRCKHVRGAPTVHIMTTHTPVIIKCSSTSIIGNALTQEAISTLTLTASVQENV